MKSSAILLAGLLLFAATLVFAEENDSAAAVPVRLEAEKLAGVGLEEFDPFPREMVLSGRSRHSYHTFFYGDELVAEVYRGRAGEVEDRRTLAV